MTYWEKESEAYFPFLSFIMAKRAKCFMCKTKLETHLLDNKWKFLTPNGFSFFLFHMQTTHGIFPDDMVDIFKKVVLKRQDNNREGD